MSQIEEVLAKRAEIEIISEDYETLILDDQLFYELTTQDKLYLESFKNCASLSFQNCALKSLINLPALPNLVRLDVSNNRLWQSAKDLSIIANTYPKLETLKLGNNLIKGDWEGMKVALSKLGESLINLDLSANPISENNNMQYREQMFEMLPLLEVLDGYDKDNKGVYSDNDDDDEMVDGRTKKSILKSAQQKLSSQRNTEAAKEKTQVSAPNTSKMVNLDDDEEDEDADVNEESKGGDKDDEEDDDYGDEEEDVQEEEADEEEIEGYYAEDEDGEQGKADDKQNEEEDDDEEDDEEENSDDRLFSSNLGKRVGGPDAAAQFASANKIQRTH
eukprot:403333693